MSKGSPLERSDSQLAEHIVNEANQQESTLTLIASENHVSKAVMEAQGSVLTNRYAEGYPGARYYGGEEYLDKIESLAIRRATDLFGADHANLQPHSGTQANLAAYLALLDPGETVLAPSPHHTGHLSHGQATNVSSQLYEFEHYKVDSNSGYLDYDSIAETAESVDPDLIVSGSSSYPREFDFERMGKIAADVDAYHVADIAHIAGLVAAGSHQNPVDYADVVTGSTHKTLKSGRGGFILCSEVYSDAVDNAVFPGHQTGALMHNIAGKAAGLSEALTSDFSDYATKVVRNAQLLGDIFVEENFTVVSRGTDKHFILVDVADSDVEVSAADATTALESVGIIVNETTIPGHQAGTSKGLRIGTPAITARGFDTDATRKVGSCMVEVLKSAQVAQQSAAIEARVSDLCEQHPVYPAYK